MPIDVCTLIAGALRSRSPGRFANTAHGRCRCLSSLPCVAELAEGKLRSIWRQGCSEGHAKRRKPFQDQNETLGDGEQMVMGLHDGSRAAHGVGQGAWAWSRLASSTQQRQVTSETPSGHPFGSCNHGQYPVASWRSWPAPSHAVSSRGDSIKSPADASRVAQEPLYGNRPPTAVSGDGCARQHNVFTRDSATTWHG